MTTSIYTLVWLIVVYSNYLYAMNYTTFEQLGFDIIKTLQHEIEKEYPDPLLRRISFSDQEFLPLAELSIPTFPDGMFKLIDEKTRWQFYLKLWSHYELGKLHYKNKSNEVAIYCFESLLHLASRSENTYEALYNGARYFLAEIYWNQRTAYSFIASLYFLRSLKNNKSTRKVCNNIASFALALLEVESELYALSAQYRLSIIDHVREHISYFDDVEGQEFEQRNQIVVNYKTKLKTQADEWKNSMRSQLIAQLKSYVALYPEEIESRDTILQLITTESDCFKRSFVNPGHITASAWLLNSDYSKVLLMHHAKLNRWLQPGGHCDGTFDTLSVAIKEAREESGIQNIKSVMSSIFDLDVHYIPERKSEPAHHHYDIRYLLKTGKSEAITKNHESTEVAWFSCDQSQFPTSERSIMRMFDKWEVLLKK